MHRFQSATKHSKVKQHKGGKGKQHVVVRKNTTFIPSPTIPTGNRTPDNGVNTSFESDPPSPDPQSLYNPNGFYGSAGSSRGSSRTSGGFSQGSAGSSGGAGGSSGGAGGSSGGAGGSSGGAGGSSGGAGGLSGGAAGSSGGTYESTLGGYGSILGGGDSPLPDYDGPTQGYGAVASRSPFPFERYTESQNLTAMSTLRISDGNQVHDLPLPFEQLERMETEEANIPVSVATEIVALKQNFSSLNRKMDLLLDRQPGGTREDDVALPELPLNTIVEQEAAERMFADSRASRDRMVRSLALIGGDTPEESLRRIMRALMAKPLREQYNAQRAQGGKRSFKITPLFRLVKDAIRRRFPDYEDTRIYKQLCLIFTRTPDEDGGREARRLDAQLKKMFTRYIRNRRRGLPIDPADEEAVRDYVHA